MTPIAIATEDELSEAVAVRLIAELQEPHYVTHMLRKGGFGYLRSKMDSWCQMAQHQLMLVLTDLDQAQCAGELREQWLSARSEPARLLLRVAVREVESWVLADHVGMRLLIGQRGTLPPRPDDLPDPKQALLRLASRAPRELKDDLLRVTEAGLAQGLGYNARLGHWVSSMWSPERAAERSPSLQRARRRLKEAVRTSEIDV